MRARSGELNVLEVTAGDLEVGQCMAVVLRRPVSGWDTTVAAGGVVKLTRFRQVRPPRGPDEASNPP